MNDKLDYLKRAFGRLCEEAVQSAQKERMNVMGQAAKQGALQSGNMLLAVKGVYDRGASETADKMVRLAFDLTGSTAGPVCAAVEQGLRALRDNLSNDLAEFFRVQANWAPRNAIDGLGNGFLHGWNDASFLVSTRGPGWSLRRGKGGQAFESSSVLGFPACAKAPGAA